MRCLPRGRVTRTNFARLTLPRSTAVWSASSLVPANRAVSWHCPSQENFPTCFFQSTKLVSVVIVCVRSHDYDVREILWSPCWRSENITHLVGFHSRKAQIHEQCVRLASSLAVPTTERKIQTFASVDYQKLLQVKENKPRTCPPKVELGGWLPLVELT